MASRADLFGGLPAPRIGAVVRAALTDFYFNSGRLVVANLIWGAAAVGLWLVWLVWPIGALILAWSLSREDRDQRLAEALLLEDPR